MIGKLPLVMQEVGSDASIALYGFAVYAISNVIGKKEKVKMIIFVSEIIGFILMFFKSFCCKWKIV